MKYFICIFWGFIYLGNSIVVEGQTAFKPTRNVVVPKSDLRILEIGDKCPDFAFDNVIRGEKGRLKISDYKGRLLILDFWSIGCGPCYAAMPKNNQLQEKFKNNVAIIPVCLVNKIDEKTIKEINNFWTTNKWTKHISLPTVLDTFMYKRMGVYGVPFEVWINQEGVIIGMTKNLEYLNEFEIQEILSGKKSEMPNMRWKNYEYEKPLIFQSPQVLNDASYIILAKNISQVRQNEFFKINNNSLKINIINYPIVEMIATLMQRIKEIKPNSFIDIIPEINVLDSLRFYYPGHGYKAEWRNNNSYCLDVAIPYNKDNYEEILLSIINSVVKQLGYDGKLVMKEILVAEISELNPQKYLSNHGSELTQNISIIEITSSEALEEMFNDSHSDAKIIIRDSVKWPSDFTLSIQADLLKDTRLFLKLLRESGFKFTESIGEKECYEINDNPTRK